MTPTQSSSIIRIRYFYSTKVTRDFLIKKNHQSFLGDEIPMQKHSVKFVHEMSHLVDSCRDILDSSTYFLHSDLTIRGTCICLYLHFCLLHNHLSRLMSTLSDILKHLSWYVPCFQIKLTDKGTARVISIFPNRTSSFAF